MVYFSNESPSSLMPFPSFFAALLYTCRKDSSEMHPIFCRYSILDGLHHFKKRIHDDLQLGKKKKNHREQDLVNRDVISVRRCSSCPETAGSSVCCEQVYYRSEAATICLANINTPIWVWLSGFLSPPRRLRFSLTTLVLGIPPKLQNPCHIFSDDSP